VGHKTTTQSTKNQTGRRKAAKHPVINDVQEIKHQLTEVWQSSNAVLQKYFCLCFAK